MDNNHENIEKQVQISWKFSSVNLLINHPALTTSLIFLIFSSLGINYLKNYLGSFGISALNFLEFSDFILVFLQYYENEELFISLFLFICLAILLAIAISHFLSLENSVITKIKNTRQINEAVLLIYFMSMLYFHYEIVGIRALKRAALVKQDMLNFITYQFEIIYLNEMMTSILYGCIGIIIYSIIFSLSHKKPISIENKTKLKVRHLTLTSSSLLISILLFLIYNVISEKTKFEDRKYFSIANNLLDMNPKVTFPDLVNESSIIEVSKVLDKTLSRLSKEEDTVNQLYNDKKIDEKRRHNYIVDLEKRKNSIKESFAKSEDEIRHQNSIMLKRLRKLQSQETVVEPYSRLTTLFDEYVKSYKYITIFLNLKQGQPHPAWYLKEQKLTPILNTNKFFFIYSISDETTLTIPDSALLATQTFGGPQTVIISPPDLEISTDPLKKLNIEIDLFLEGY